jgi:hypothetical protein
MSLSAPKTDEDDKSSPFSLIVDEDTLTKDETKPFYAEHLNVPRGANTLRISSPDAFSEFSVEENGDRRRGRSGSQRPLGRRDISRSPAPPPKGLTGWCKAFWKRNKGLALVLLAQVFGTLMNVTTRYGLKEAIKVERTDHGNRILELEGNNGKGMHPFQVFLSLYIYPLTLDLHPLRFCLLAWALLLYWLLHTCGTHPYPISHLDLVKSDHF